MITDIVNGTDRNKYMTEKIFERDGKRIYGKLYEPDVEDNGNYPIVIIGHGYGEDSSDVENYANAFARHGIGAYAFDFIGGSKNSRSEGEVEEMSVLTEARDLDTVLDGIEELPNVDKDNIFLVGESQGGFVASYVASKRGEELKGLMALYPAYVIHDDAWRRTPDPKEIPEKMNMMGMTIGRKYNEDAMSFNIYDMLPDYDGNVLILHGTSDHLVPIAYSEKAVEKFPSAELVKIDDAGHGFHGADDKFATKRMIRFVKENVAAGRVS